MHVTDRLVGMRCMQGASMGTGQRGNCGDIAWLDQDAACPNAGPNRARLTRTCCLRLHARSLGPGYPLLPPVSLDIKQLQSASVPLTSVNQANSAPDLLVSELS